MSEVRIEALLENTAELAICITIWDKNQSSGKTSCQVGKGKQERKEKTGKGWLGNRNSFAILSKQDTTTGNSEGNENATWVQMLLMGEKNYNRQKNFSTGRWKELRFTHHCNSSQKAIKHQQGSVGFIWASAASSQGIPSDLSACWSRKESLFPAVLQGRMGSPW